MRAAVQAYQAYGKQPIEMVACAALSSTSLVCQGLADVGRDKNLIGPCSLDIVTIAVSGERKTAIDKRLRRAATLWQREKRDDDAPQIEEAEQRLAGWKATREGLLNKIKRLAGAKKPEDIAELKQFEQDLIELTKKRPPVPLFVKLFYEDITPERLATSLAEGWPSASLWSDEGALVIGSHSMSEEVALRFLGLLNRLWDGNPFDRDRQTSASAYIIGRRFTASLMLQPMVLSAWLAIGDGVVRGLGALARYLMTWPTSTMGTRLHVSGDLDCPELKAYDNRLHTLLELPLPLKDGALEPPVLFLSPPAFEMWRKFHDMVEVELGAHGKFGELPDFGAKIAEQAARIACIFHVFMHGPTGEISAETMRAGARVAFWHLHEARRIFDAVGYSGETGDAEHLLQWLLKRQNPNLLQKLQLGPYRLRGKKRRDAAIAVLVDHSLIRLEKHDGITRLVINPKGPA